MTAPLLMQNLRRQDEHDGTRDPYQGTAHSQGRKDTDVEQDLQRTPNPDCNDEDRLAGKHDPAGGQSPGDRHQRNPGYPHGCGPVSRRPGNQNICENRERKRERQSRLNATAIAHEANSNRKLNIANVPRTRVVPEARVYRTSMPIR